MTEAQRTSYVFCQVHALAAFATALATVYPDAPLLQKHFETLSQLALSHLENLTEAFDQLIEGFQVVTDALRETLVARAAS